MAAREKGTSTRRLAWLDLGADAHSIIPHLRVWIEMLLDYSGLDPAEYTSDVFCTL